MEVCKKSGCERAVYARKLCQTHHRQLLTTGKMGSIRPYRARTKGTVKYAGIRTTAPVVRALKAEAKQSGESTSAVISRVLEVWARNRNVAQIAA